MVEDLRLMGMYGLAEIYGIGKSWHKLHYIHVMWRNAKSRCHNSSHPTYHLYGGRGIQFYNEWLDNSQVFILWILNNLGPRPNADYSIDRIDNSSGYVPGNLQWATQSEQNSNRCPYKFKAYPMKYILQENAAVWIVRVPDKQGRRTQIRVNSLEKALKLRDELQAEYR